MTFLYGLYLRNFVIVIFCLQGASVNCEKYVVSVESANWYQALINCKNAGMELASIHSAEEQNELEIFLKQNGYNKGYWLAGTNEGNGEFYWATTGLKAVYTKWISAQPDNNKSDDNNNEGEHCVQWGMGNYAPDEIGWNDATCTNLYSYICQRFEYCYQ